VLDVFAGNFNFNSSDDSTDENERLQPQQPALEQSDFADFANFDDAAVVTMPTAVEKTPCLVDDGGKDELEFTSSSIDAIDEDFGPFSSASANEKEQEPSPFLIFDTVGISGQDDRFELEPMKSSDFEDTFGGASDPGIFLSQDKVDDPFAVGDMAERTLPMMPDLTPKEKRLFSFPVVSSEILIIFLSEYERRKNVARGKESERADWEARK
jgi:hypothetical protein